MADNLSPAKLFLSYSHKDEHLLDGLRTHLKIMERRGLIAPWHDRSIDAGSEWKGAIDENLEAADIILLLISPDFLNSDYCWDVELSRAIERHNTGEARVIPIFLRHCDWAGAPFSKLQGLPTDAHPVTDARWSSIDEAYTVVAKGIRAVLEKKLQSTSKHRDENIKPTTPQSENKPEIRPMKDPLRSDVVVDNTGSWVLLDGNLINAEQVDDARDGHGQRRIKLVFAECNAQQIAHLRSLDPGTRGSREHISFAHNDEGFRAKVTSVSSLTVKGVTAWTVNIEPISPENVGMEMAYNQLSADDLAALRARLLLLDERPNKNGNQYLESMLWIGTDITIKNGIFPGLWNDHKSDPNHLYHARLLAIFYLKILNICEDVLDLTLGPVVDHHLHVTFRGQRRKIYSNTEPKIIAFSGTCPLTPVER